MLIYIILLSSLCVGNFFDLFKVKERYVLFLINFIILFILVSTRYGVGPDYMLYKGLYSEAKPIYDFSLEYWLNNKYNIEIGYLFLESLVKGFTDDFSEFLFLYNVIVFTIIFLGILNTKNYNIQLFIFFTLFHVYYMSGERQMMAMAIFLYNIKNLINERYIRFFILSVIGCLFHTYGFLYIFLMFLYKSKFIKHYNKKKFIFIILLFSLFIGYIDLIGEVIKYFYIKFNSFSYVFSRLYGYYFDTIGSINSMNILRVIMIFGIVTIFWDKVDNRLNLVLVLYVLIFLIFIKFSSAGGLAFRLSDGLLILLIPYASFIIENKNIFSMKKKIFFCVFITLYGCIVFGRILYVHIFFDINTFLPYQSILL